MRNLRCALPLGFLSGIFFILCVALLLYDPDLGLGEVTDSLRFSNTNANVLTSKGTLNYAGRPGLKMKPCSESVQMSEKRVHVNISDVDLNTVESLNKNVKGGHWEPADCSPKMKVAILITLRNRDGHLRVILQHLHPFLQKQGLFYTIFVMEQTYEGLFNKGLLHNVGVKKALEEDNFDCFIFQDVDLLPEVESNVYRCYENPTLMASARSKSDYEMPYGTYFGGVTSISAADYIKVNGYSNRFLGWGCEDDEFRERIIFRGLKPDILPLHIGRYATLDHKQSVYNHNRENILNDNLKNLCMEGLNTTQYELIKKEKRQLYTWYLIKNHHKEIVLKKNSSE